MDMESKLERLRAAANPARLDILEVLRARGPMSPSDITKMVPRVRGGIAHHVKVLVEQGFVEQHADGKVAALPLSIEWTTDEFDDPTWVATVQVLDRVLVQRRIDRMRTWSEQESSWPQGWRDVAFSGDSLLLLTAQELDAMGAELEAVAQKYRVLSRERDSTEGEDVQSVFFVVAGFPFRRGADS